MRRQFQRQARRTQSIPSYLNVPRWIARVLRAVYQPLLGVLVMAFACSCQNRVKERGPFSFSEKIDSLFITTSDFSGVVLIAEHGNPVYHKAYGYRSYHNKIANDTSSIFELASVSKQFTATVLVMLKQDGKLNYDDLVEKYIPGLPYPGITIRHLLNHTSGLPDYQAIMDQYWDKSKVAGNSDNIEYLIRYKPARLFAPGEQYEYSNTGYMLLASVAEKASGKEFIALCRERIFSPLQMTSTDIRTKDEKVTLSNMAWGHLWVPERLRYIQADSFRAFNYAIWLGNRKGPGRVSSTSSDLLKWDQALYDERVVTQEALKEAFTAAVLNNGTTSDYGFGWELQQDKIMGKVVRHSGDNPGYKTHIVRYIDQNKTIILLSNNASAQFNELLRGIEVLIKRKHSGR